MSMTAAHNDLEDDTTFKVVDEFYPTLGQMLNLATYVYGIEDLYISTGRKLPPFIKLIPPSEWAHIKQGFNIDFFLQNEGRNEIPVVKQIYTNRRKPENYVFTMVADEFKGQSYKTLFEDKTRPPPNLSLEELEEEFWKRRSTTHSKYAQGFESSLFPADMKEGNLNYVNGLLSRLKEVIPGVTTSYIYVSTWKSGFGWHIEDVDLHSISYNHYGAAKTWFGVSESDSAIFETIAAVSLPENYKKCKNFLRHKDTFIKPDFVNKHVRVTRAYQNAGEYIVTFPRSYHSGYNNGFSIAEAKNFATPTWIEFGKSSKRCSCEERSFPEIDMSIFTNDVHPEFSTESQQKTETAMELSKFLLNFLEDGGEINLGDNDVDVYQEDGTLSLVNEMRSAESSFIEKPIKCVENPPKGSQKSDSIQDDKAQEILPLQPVSTLNPNSLVTVAEKPGKVRSDKRKKKDDARKRRCRKEKKEKTSLYEPTNKDITFF